MQTLPDTAILRRLRTEDSAAFEILYRLYFPSITQFVVQNSGCTEDAEDVFQEAIIVLLEKSRESDFILTSSLKTFIFAIAKNIWLKRIRDNRLRIVAKDYSLDRYADAAEMPVPAAGVEKTREERLQDWMGKISENCRRILKALFFLREPMETLMRKMGWKNRHTADNQKYKCIQQVIKEKRKDMGD